MGRSRKIRRIIIHCSASDFGDVALFRQWHIQRGFVDVGYHYVILNGRRRAHSQYNPEEDGLVEEGRPLWQEGAHTKGHNEDSIGICLVGNPKFIGSPEMWFTPRQLGSLRDLVARLMKEFAIPPEQIHGHNEYAPKLCPGFYVSTIRDWWR